jgi:hypothetical protein
MNGDAELKEKDLVSCIINLGTIITSPRNLWRKLNAENVICLKLSREVQVELLHQMWTTATNLGDWYDHFESLCIEYGFGDDGGVGMLIPQVRPAHKYSISPWEMIHLPGGDNAVGR